MKLPRDVSANQLIKALRVLGYSIDHQRGSHIRIATQLNGQHHETIPNHNPIKVGTLARIFRTSPDITMSLWKTCYRNWICNDATRNPTV
jgi:predicted RNA binding protein YcfA (HicA-like mRNA interferase family)